jgi:hypothetical protein
VIYLALYWGSCMDGRKSSTPDVVKTFALA